MKKKSLHKMLILGISSAACMSIPAEAGTTKPLAPTKVVASSPLSPEVQTFAKKLNSAMLEIFTNMSEENRTLVMKMAQMKCGHNTCKGLGGCKTKKHACKGLNDCKNQGGCKLSPNESVNLLNKKLNGKRANVL